MDQIMIYSFILVLTITTLLQIDVVQIFTLYASLIRNNQKHIWHKKKEYFLFIFSFYTYIPKHISEYLLKNTDSISKQIIYPMNCNQYIIINKTINSTQHPLYTKTILSQTLQYG